MTEPDATLPFPLSGDAGRENIAAGIISVKLELPPQPPDNPPAIMQSEVLQILQAPDYAQQIARGAELLASGKLLLLPTETVYGVAGVLSNPDARAALARVRQSAPGKPFTVHIARSNDALQYLGKVSDFGQRVIRKLWPGPVGLMFDVPTARQREVAGQWALEPGALYDGSKITIRCPDHPVFFDLVSGVREPLALTVPPGLSPRTADLPAEVLSQVEMVFDAGETRFAKPSTVLHVKENTYDIVRQGVYDERIIDRMLKTTILFVCSGNTCRSPMAEVIATDFLANKLHVSAGELENKGINVISAGSFAMPGAKAAAPAIDVMQKMGLDLTRHRSRPLSVELIHQADVIYTMSRRHARDVISLVPAAADKVSPLDPAMDIEDPIGGDIALYDQVAMQLKRLIEQRLDTVIVG
jgi:protein-tyrosine phosphatase